jgi:hypothetical protein
MPTGTIKNYGCRVEGSKLVLQYYSTDESSCINEEAPFVLTGTKRQLSEQYSVVDVHIPRRGKPL